MKKNMLVIAAIIIIVASFAVLGVIGKILYNNISAKSAINNQTAQKKADTQKSKKKISVAAQTEKITRTSFQTGDSGDDVKLIQKLINKFGYNITADGKYGEETTYIVMDFQKKHKIILDGKVSGLTLDALKKAPDPSTMYQASAQSVLSASDAANKAKYESVVNNADCNSYTNYFIVVNLSEQKVYIYNGTNHNWQLINEFQCASGSASSPTIPGHYFLGVKDTQFVLDNGTTCKYYSQIQGNMLFHSILFDKNGNVIDPTLGASVSHGCVRLALENAKYIYDDVPIGSGIWIY